MLATRSRVPSVAISLVTLALAARFVALGTMCSLQATLLPRAVPALAFDASHRTADVTPARPDPCAILARNIFDPSTGALCPPNAVDPKPPRRPSPPEPGELAPACGAESAKLVGTVHSERYPEWSLAEVATGPGHASSLLRSGERWDEMEVFAIYPRAVLFKQPSGHYCSLTLFGEDAPACTAPHCVRGADPSRSATEFTLQRALVDELLHDHHSLQAIPHEQNGRLIGVKLYGIRRSSPWSQLGLHNGDLLRAINGLEVTTPDAALSAYAQLRSASRISLAIERRGEPMTLRYEIE